MTAGSPVVGPTSVPEAGAGRGPGAWPWLASVAAAALVLGPALGPGSVLLRDMVFVPSPALTGRLVGLGHETPRAVPSDLVVALASHVLPAGVVQAVVLFAVLVGAGVGASRLVPASALPASAAALFAVWNPYVGERLLMGQWALLVGYAACPWVVLGAARVARGRDGALPLSLGLVVGGLGGAAAWVLLVLSAVGALAGVAVATRQVRPVVTSALRWVPLVGALALPWAVPALLRPGEPGSDPAGFDLFAPGADTLLGGVGSLVTGGGTWNVAAVPPGRGSVVGAVAAVTVVGWALGGLWLTRRGPVAQADPVATSLRAPVLGAGVAGLAVGLVSLAGASLGALARVPGGGLLRDGARELAPWLLLLAVGLGWGAAWLAATGLPRLVAVLVVLLPLVALPGLGWGVSGRLGPVQLPAEVRAVAEAADAAPGPGSVVVLPFEGTRSYAWNADRPSLTPWPRLLHRRVVVSSDLVVATPGGLRTVAGEDAYASAVRRALTLPDPLERLAALGVGWVVVDAPGVTPPEGAVRVAGEDDTALYRLPGVPVSDAEVADAFDPPTAPVLLGDAVAALAAVAAAALAVRRRDARSSRAPGPRAIG
jgi:hypothetical protein